jgi:hypothetical protein
MATSLFFDDAAAQAAGDTDSDQREKHQALEFSHIFLRWKARPPVVNSAKSKKSRAAWRRSLP